MMESGTSKNLSFAEQIIKKYKKFGRYGLTEPSLVFLQQNMGRIPSVTTTRNTWLKFYINLSRSGQILQKKLFLESSRTLYEQVKKKTEKILYRSLRYGAERMIHDRIKQETERIMRRSLHYGTERMIHDRIKQETERIMRRSLHYRTDRMFTERVKQETDRVMRGAMLYHTDRLLSEKVKQETEKRLRQSGILQRNLSYWTNRASGGGAPGKIQLFQNISTIFENRERQPDQARKAEKKLIRILSNDFFSNMETVNLFRTALLGAEWDDRQREGQERSGAKWDKVYRFEESSRRTEETIEQTRILKRQTYEEEELEKTRYLVENLKERVTVQENLMKELQQTTASGQILQPSQVDGIARAVLKKMERELHQEKLRRGLY